MLTGRLLRARVRGDQVTPIYIDSAEPTWMAAAQGLIDVFRRHRGESRGVIEEEIREISGNDPAQLVHQGFAKLLEDRSEFDVVAGQPPDQVREMVFGLAAERRKTAEGFDRDILLAEAATRLEMTSDAVDRSLFADLKTEQRLIHFEDITPERLIERYNVALAQAVLLRSTGILINVKHEAPARYRQLLRNVKFRRLVCEIEAIKPEGHRLHLDGPLSLFSATQKYGVQLALFLPAVLLCRDFELKADLRWGPRREIKRFTLTSENGLVSHDPDRGMYVPPEIGMFVDLFRKKVDAWEISEETELLPLGKTYWAPDFRLIEKATGRIVYLDVLGFWRRSQTEAHLRRLQENARVPFILAISEQLRVDEGQLEGLPAEIYRFRQLPLPEEIARLASVVLAQKS
jgi:predicted nuclease of restriction endonuclease-like RecB superfamily